MYYKVKLLAETAITFWKHSYSFIVADSSYVSINYAAIM